MDPMRDLLVGLGSAPESVRVLYGVVQADGSTLIDGVTLRPVATAQTRSDVVAGARVVVLRTGAADSAHIIIGTL